MDAGTVRETTQGGFGRYSPAVSAVLQSTYSLGQLLFDSVQQAIEVYARACMSVSSLLEEQSLIHNLELLRNSHIQLRSSLIQWPSSPQSLAYDCYSSS